MTVKKQVNKVQAQVQAQTEVKETLRLGLRRRSLKDFNRKDVIVALCEYYWQTFKDDHAQEYFDANPLLEYETRYKVLKQEFYKIWNNSEFIGYSKEQLLKEAEEIGFKTESELFAWHHQILAGKKEKKYDNTASAPASAPKPASDSDLEGLF